MDQSVDQADIDKILMRKGDMFLVRWKGYRAVHDTWEPRAKLSHCAKKLAKFRRSEHRKPLVDAERRQWSVEAILDMRTEDGSRWYLMKWKGFSAEHNSWEPLGSMSECGDMVSEFDHKLATSNRDEALKGEILSLQRRNIELRLHLTIQRLEELATRCPPADDVHVCRVNRAIAN